MARTNSVTAVVTFTNRSPGAFERTWETSSSTSVAAFPSRLMEARCDISRHQGSAEILPLPQHIPEGPQQPLRRLRARRHRDPPISVDRARHTAPVAGRPRDRRVVLGRADRPREQSRPCLRRARYGIRRSRPPIGRMRPPPPDVGNLCRGWCRTGGAPEGERPWRDPSRRDRSRAHRMWLCPARHELPLTIRLTRPGRKRDPALLRKRSTSLRKVWIPDSGCLPLQKHCVRHVGLRCFVFG